MKQSTFSIKDLINVGLFTLLIFIFTFISGMIGFFPLAFPIVPFVGGLVSGPVFMLYFTKIHHFGMFLITGILISLIYVATGHTILFLLGGIFFSFCSEYILKLGKYKNIGKARLAYAVYSLNAMFGLVPMYFTRDAFLKDLYEKGYGSEYAKQLMSVLPDWSFFPIVLSGGIGGYIGCTIGIRMLNKHFKKAGLV
ncbi:MAG: MptD family putative ECF transporter S component [Streptococcus sp.]|nr:MptD family putative ECF transporter S component [Streptococcus sp.]